jgi:hypothetical protein
MKRLSPCVGWTINSPGLNGEANLGGTINRLPDLRDL